MGTKCEACGHQHAGADLAYICIGCPCSAQPGRELDIEDSPTRPATLFDDNAADGMGDEEPEGKR